MLGVSVMEVVSPGQPGAGEDEVGELEVGADEAGGPGVL